MTTTTPDLQAIKARQQKTWASGDFAVVAAKIVVVSEVLVDNADLRAGWRVLDVACGNGNAALAAARCDTQVVGVDYVPALLEGGRARAVAEGLDVTFVDGDAENLPAEDNSYDAALSVFGTMFAPDHRRTAAEILRVTRPGGRVGLVSWTPDGFIGQLFRIVTRYVPPPAGVQSPLLWGTEKHLAELFGDAATDVRHVERAYVWRHRTPEDLVAFLRRWYGPTLKAFEALDEPGRTAFAADLADLARRLDRNADGGSIAVPSTYLETVFTVR